MTTNKQAYVWGMILPNEVGMLPEHLFYGETRARVEVLLEDYWKKNLPTYTMVEVFRNPRKIIYETNVSKSRMTFMLWGPINHDL